MKDKARLIGTIAVLICAAMFIYIGVSQNEPMIVLKKSIMICMECIGLGR